MRRGDHLHTCKPASFFAETADADAEKLERAEHGLVRREESEILTQAAVDALRPAAVARRPSVVQFRELEKATPGSAREVELGSGKSKFQVLLAAKCQFSTPCRALNTLVAIINMSAGSEVLIPHQRSLLLGPAECVSELEVIKNCC